MIDQEDQVEGYGAMNPHTKRKWVKALRSGEYTQGTSALIMRDLWGSDEGVTTRCCCLGVLLMETTPEFCSLEHAKPDADGEFGVQEGSGVATGTIPEDLAMTYDLTDEAQELLAEMNDNGGSFPTIADWIEENL